MSGEEAPEFDVLVAVAVRSALAAQRSSYAKDITLRAVSVCWNPNAPKPPPHMSLSICECLQSRAPGNEFSRPRARGMRSSSGGTDPTSGCGYGTRAIGLGQTWGLGFDAASVGEPNLGWIVENRALQSALLAQIEHAGGRIVERSVLGLEFAPGHCGVITEDGALRARLVIGADGGRSRVREFAGLAAHAKSYEQSALLCVVATERPHRSTAWQRFLGGGTLAFLPLPDGSSSIVWSVATDVAERLEAAPVDAFERELVRHSISRSARSRCIASGGSSLCTKSRPRAT